MSFKSQYDMLFAYHWDTMRRLMERAAALSAADYTAQPGYGRGSIHDLLVHLLRTDQSWRLSLEQGRQVAAMPAEAFPDLAAVRAGFAQEQAAWDALLAGLDDAAVGAGINLVSRRGDVLTFPRWRVLQHLALHSMQHAAEAAQLLTEKGQSPGDIDFIFYRPV